MKKDLEEEIRAQLLANQEMLAGAEGTGMSWEEKVQQFKMTASQNQLSHTYYICNQTRYRYNSDVVVDISRQKEFNVTRVDLTKIKENKMAAMFVQNGSQ